MVTKRGKKRVEKKAKRLAAKWVVRLAEMKAACLDANLAEVWAGQLVGLRVGTWGTLMDRGLAATMVTH